MRDLPQIIDYDKEQLAYALANAIKERDEARNKMADALQEVDLRTLDFERMKQERDGLLLELEEYRSIAENIGAVKAVSEKEKAIRERDEAIADRDIARLSALDSDRAHDRMVAELEKVYKERDEAWACCDELVVDSNAITLAKTVMKLERERDEAREALARITEAAQAVVDRWEQPAWKDAEPTAAVIYRLRDALGREAK